MGELRIRARIIGQVQGVGYRYFVLRQAGKYSLSGFARNEFDGSVTVEAQGSEEALKQLIASLREGPRLARVEKVDSHWLDPISQQDGFEVY